MNQGKVVNYSKILIKIILECNMKNKRITEKRSAMFKKLTNQMKLRKMNNKHTLILMNIKMIFQLWTTITIT